MRLVKRYQTVSKKWQKRQSMLENGEQLREQSPMVYALVNDQMQNYDTDSDYEGEEDAQFATYDEIREALVLPVGIIQKYSDVYKTMYYAKYECVLYDAKYPDWIQVNTLISYDVDAFDYEEEDDDECFYCSRSIMTNRMCNQIRKTIA